MKLGKEKVDKGRSFIFEGFCILFFGVFFSELLFAMGEETKFSFLTGQGRPKLCTFKLYFHELQRDVLYFRLGIPSMAGDKNYNSLTSSSFELIIK